MVTVEVDKVTIVEEKHDILVFYAASIGHLFRDRSEDPPDNAATAGS
ncbi:hypothetical protein [Thalassovita autumnalis]|nr:hypothetical protein [Thalassovita autumnalis]